MKDTDKGYARIKSVTMKNFRNIEYGKVKFANGDLESFYEGASSITGIYGQNGSGKTAVLLAISILGKLLRGEQLTASNLIKAGCESANLCYEISIYDDSYNRYNVVYSFDIFYDELSKAQMLMEEDSLEEGSANKKDVTAAIVKNETIEYDGLACGGKRLRHKVLFSTIEEYCAEGTKPFGTQKGATRDAAYQAIVSNELLRAKLLTRREDALIAGKSFFFYVSDEKAARRASYSWSVPDLLLPNILDEHDKAVYAWLSMFGYYIIVNMIAENGLVSLNRLPLTLFDVSQAYALKRPLLKLDEEFTMTKKGVDDFARHIKRIGDVLSQLIPGVEIRLKIVGEYNTSVDADAVKMRCELVTVRDGYELPLKEESNGIKRIISFATVFIAAYNNPFVTFAIDEFDAGIYEDLLGKLAIIFEESGKGQMIFTSHNLRPLEVLDWKSIVFTTTNPQNRFDQLPKAKTNNLRDQYLRIIKQGGAKENFYNNPDEYELELKLALSGEDGVSE